MTGFDRRAERGAIVIASFAAAGVPVAPFALVAIPAPGLAVFILVFGLVVAALHVAILFLPAWILLSRRTRLDWPATSALGLVCGALPSLILWPRTGVAVRRLRPGRRRRLSPGAPLARSHRGMTLAGTQTKKGGPEGPPNLSSNPPQRSTLR